MGKHGILVIVCTALTRTARPASAVGPLPDSAPSCLQQAAARIKPGQWLRVLRTDKTKIEGRLLSITAAGDVPGIHLQGDIPDVWYTDIAGVQYRRAGKPQPTFMILGGVVGAAVGFAIALPVLDALDRPSWDDRQNRETGAIIGAGVGFLAGTVLSIALPSTRTIRCR